MFIFRIYYLVFISKRLRSLGQTIWIEFGVHKSRSSHQAVQIQPKPSTPSSPIGLVIVSSPAALKYRQKAKLDTYIYPLQILRERIH